MRIAVFSDVHGNVAALEAVLADAATSDHPSADWLIGKLTTPWGAGGGE